MESELSAEDRDHIEGLKLEVDSLYLNGKFDHGRWDIYPEHVIKFLKNKLTSYITSKFKNEMDCDKLKKDSVNTFISDSFESIIPEYKKILESEVSKYSTSPLTDKKDKIVRDGIAKLEACKDQIISDCQVN